MTGGTDRNDDFQVFVRSDTDIEALQMEFLNLKANNQGMVAIVGEGIEAVGVTDGRTMDCPAFTNKATGGREEMSCPRPWRRRGPCAGSLAPWRQGTLGASPARSGG